MGVFSPPDATMHPARWVRAFSRAIEQQGVRIFERSPVPEPLEARAQRRLCRAQRAKGPCTPQRVVVAADGALPQLVPYYAPSVRTKRLHMIATAPIAERVVPCRDRRALGLRVPAAAAGRAHRAGRLLGLRRRGRSRLLHDGRAGLARRPRPYRAFPARRSRHRRSGDAPLGRAGRVLARPARVRRRRAGHDGLYVAGGYNGTGNLNGFTAGRILWELLATGQSADAQLYDSARALSPPEDSQSHP